MSNTELKPCPFCGGEAEKESCGNYWIKCKNCESKSKICNNFEEAIEAWNRRVNQ